MNSGNAPIESRHRMLTTIGWGIGGRITYCLEGSVFIGGEVVQWLRDGLGLIGSSAEVEDAGGPGSRYGRRLFRARVRRLGSALLGSLRPRRDRRTHARNDRGPSGTGGAGIDGLPNPRRIGGDAKRRRHRFGRFEGRWRRVGQSSDDAVPGGYSWRTGAPARCGGDDALGAAYLAGLAVGYWESTDELKRNWAVDDTYLPKMPPAERDAKYARWHKAVERSMRWAVE